MVNPGGRVVGRSLREWTTRSTLQERQETRSHTSSVLQSDARQHLGPLKSKRPFKEDEADGRGGANQLAAADTHSFLSRAFSSSLVNKLFSPI